MTSVRLGLISTRRGIGRVVTSSARPRTAPWAAPPGGRSGRQAVSPGRRARRRPGTIPWRQWRFSRARSFAAVREQVLRNEVDARPIARGRRVAWRGPRQRRAKRRGDVDADRMGHSHSASRAGGVSFLARASSDFDRRPPQRAARPTSPPLDRDGQAQARAGVSICVPFARQPESPPLLRIEASEPGRPPLASRFSGGGDSTGERARRSRRSGGLRPSTGSASGAA
jgi:hypothetical protein